MTLLINDVSFRAGERMLLQNISVVAHRGEIIAIVGPNGAGKSTLLRLAAGLLHPLSGKVTLDGNDVPSLAPDLLAKRRAMLAQDFLLRARFSIRELVQMGALHRTHTRPARSTSATVMQALEQVGLAHLADRDIMSLSGGERQRAHFARVLVQLRAGEGPSGLLLLDEPISAQDLARQKLILGIAREHTRQGEGMCVMVLHDLNWAAAIADRIIVLCDGRVHAEGTPLEILTTDMLRAIFRVETHRVHIHDHSGRPFITPHDVMASSFPIKRENTQCTSP
ncbi:heme ABC transporter ATP-binding protein [Acetobacter oeni]|uniref:Hemin import ATP-binding protein HmuV n=1 Tax=Acetobacter oeni TaxID=304077 RepID=A0A511XPG4_9PROT|nr:heme ABC transporter ATP-binding protein [Acetobacter oeni]MBB3884189.1 iron complex transport system ATP-binding protein [Acetobacter oeni]NHO20278.1 heme ABC transporter ATP-binding protein [Acetobacter oeni]GBR03662.1 ferrichrome transporter ATP-binding protein [Acetobacter oeni LMG 21952]GEN64796.1 hemin import ATP-binding protein HmuV [Acetobacter oeni]